MVISIHFYIPASKELNVIDSSVITLVVTKLKYEELPRIIHFRQLIHTLYHVLFIPIHDMALNATVLAGNNKITLPNQVP